MKSSKIARDKCFYEYKQRIDSFCRRIESTKRPDKGNCYLYFADIDQSTTHIPVLDQYNPPLGTSKDILSLKNEIELIINTSTKAGKNVVIAYERDEVIGICLGK